MTEATDNETKLTYETAIRSFTEAEVALREIVSALERYRAASDSVETADAAVSSSQAALAAALATFETTSVELTSSATSLRGAATTIAALGAKRRRGHRGTAVLRVTAERHPINSAIGVGSLTIWFGRPFGAYSSLSGSMPSFA